jgi:hypothetical protein
MDSNTTIHNFIRTFVPGHKRERTELELRNEKKR